MDTDIPYRVAGLIFALIQVLCIIILMSQVGWPVLILFIIILGISFWYQVGQLSSAPKILLSYGSIYAYYSYAKWPYKTYLCCRTIILVLHENWPEWLVLEKLQSFTISQSQ